MKWTIVVLALLMILLTTPPAKAMSVYAPKKHIAVICGGWGGVLARPRRLLGEASYRVTLLHALPDPTGNTPFLTPSGKPFEAGTLGFWFDYPNINELVSTTLFFVQYWDIHVRYTVDYVRGTTSTLAVRSWLLISRSCHRCSHT